MRTHPSRLALLLVAGLAACGGGGGGSATPPPASFTYSDSDALLPSGVEIAPLLPIYDGADVSWSIEPALPAGLVLDASTGVIAGTPVAPTPRRLYKVTATNAGGVVHTPISIEIAAPARFAFVVGGADDTLSSFGVETGSGRLARAGWTLSDVPDTGAEQLALHPSNRFGYLPHAGSNTIAVLGLDPHTGAADPRGSVSVGAGPHAAAVDPTGAFLVVACRGADELQVFAIDADTGDLTQVGSAEAGTQPTDLAFSPDGAVLLVTTAGRDFDGLGSSLRAYALNRLTGALSPLSAALMLNGGRPSALAVDPHDPYVYLALREFGDALAVRFSSSGQLTPVGPLRSAGEDPVDITVDARGRFVYAAARGDDQIRAFRVSPTTHGLSGAGAFTVGLEPVALQSDPLGVRIYAVARGSSELLTYTIQEDGALAGERATALRNGSSALVFARGDAPLKWSPRCVHVADGGSDDVLSYAIDAQTGALTQTGVAATGDRPVALASAPRLRFVLVLTAGAGTLESFRPDAVTGALTPAGAPIPVGSGAAQVVLDGSGRFAYVVTHDLTAGADGWLHTVAVDAVSGALTLLDSRPAGAGSCYVALDPAGNYAYVANGGDGAGGSATIAAFRIDPRTGLPAPSGSAVSVSGIARLAFHPDGRSIYAVLNGPAQLARFSVDRASGALESVQPPSSTTLEPAALALDPRGRFAYVAYTDLGGAGQVDVLPVRFDGSFDASIQQVVDGEDPFDMAVEPSGRFLYAANVGSNDVSVFAIDPATGELAARTPALAGTGPRAILATGTTH